MCLKEGTIGFIVSPGVLFILQYNSKTSPVASQQYLHLHYHARWRGSLQFAPRIFSLILIKVSVIRSLGKIKFLMVWESHRYATGLALEFCTNDIGN